MRRPVYSSNYEFIFQMLNLRPSGKSISKRYTLNDFWIKHKMRETRCMPILVSIAVELDAAQSWLGMWQTTVSLGLRLQILAQVYFNETFYRD